MGAISGAPAGARSIFVTVIPGFAALTPGYFPWPLRGLSHLTDEGRK
jgi:hypothetical protein